MKKRGEHRARAPARKKAAKAAPVSRAIVRDESREILSAGRLIRREEQKIEKGISFAFGPSELHVTAFVACIIILGFIFNSLGIIFYSVLTAGVLLFAHFMKQHHRPHDVITILGIFFLPLAFTLMAFQETLVYVLVVVYILSLISTVIIYYYHKKAHSLLKVMWQVTYSKMVALTLALVVACALPLVFPAVFFSVIELIFFYVLPVVFVFFLASKFFYLYFFDRKHIRHDLALSLRHTLIYSLVFVVMLMCIYSLFAVSFYNSQKQKFDDQLDTSLVLVSEMEDSVKRLPADIYFLPVTKDALSFAGMLHDNVSGLKRGSLDRLVSLSDILDDSYVSELEDDTANTLRLVLWDAELASLKMNIVRKHDAVNAVIESKGSFSDGSTTLDGHVRMLKDYAEANFVPYSMEPDIQDFFSKLNDAGMSYDDFGGFSYLFAAKPEMAGDFGYVYNSGSIFGRQMSVVTRHMSIYRDIAQLILDIQMFVRLEELSPSSVEHLYANRAGDTVPLSMAIRYEILAESAAKSQGKRLV
jgi:hypothetical protein